MAGTLAIAPALPVLRHPWRAKLSTHFYTLRSQMDTVVQRGDGNE
jgi:hypothetical protein